MASGGAAAFKNVYYRREVATAKSCWVCYKETTTCLATVDVSDFVYTCPSHLGDTGFCKPIVEPSDEPTALPEVTQADIDRVKAEYEAKQVAKKAKDKDKDKEEAKKADDKSSKPTTPTPPAVVTQKPPPRKFALQRDFFAMRIDAQRTKAAKAVSLPSAPRTLPTVPRTALPPPK